MLPAYAGMIRARVRLWLSRRRAPRVCGDDPMATQGRGVAYVCSPRMRG